MLLIGGDTIDLSKKDIHVFLIDEKYPSEKYKEIISEIYQNFFAIPIIEDFIQIVSRDEKIVRKTELRIYFTFLHLIAIEVIQKVYKKHNLMADLNNSPNMGNIESSFLKLLKSLNEGMKLMPEVDLPEVIGSSVFIGPNLLAEIKSRMESLSLSKFQNNRLFVFHRFVDSYFSAIENLVYPRWFAACFMKKIDNPIVWSHYADSHRGICLKFKFDKTADYISLSGVTGWTSNGVGHGNKQFQLHEVNYTKKYLQIDFFRSLGMLTGYVLDKYWYHDEAGNQSRCAEDLSSNNDAWRKKYWDTYIKLATSKFDAWEYESEVRLVLNARFSDTYTTAEERKYKYDFEMLEGIIFGVNTSMEDKVKVVAKIEDKCKAIGRDDFNFYQAFYDSSGKIKYNLAFHYSRRAQ